MGTSLAGKIVYKTGSALDGPEPALVHGCNAQGAMGAGIAVPIKNRWPQAFDAYRRHYLSEGLRLGEVIAVQCADKLVLNAITQEWFGRKSSTPYVSYEAIRECFAWINSEIAGGEVAMPLIGAGLAGGHWPTIASIIEEQSLRFRPVVYTLDGIIPA